MHRDALAKDAKVLRSSHPCDGHDL